MFLKVGKELVVLNLGFVRLVTVLVPVPDATPGDTRQLNSSERDNIKRRPGDLDRSQEIDEDT